MTHLFAHDQRMRPNVSPDVALDATAHPPPHQPSIPMLSAEPRAGERGPSVRFQWRRSSHLLESPHISSSLLTSHRISSTLLVSHPISPDLLPISPYPHLPYSSHITQVRFQWRRIYSESKRPPSGEVAFEAELSMTTDRH